jgi:hypothetical protein
MHAFLMEKSGMFQQKTGTKNTLAKVLVAGN